MANANFKDYVRMVKGANSTIRMIRGMNCLNGYSIGRKYTKGKALKDTISLVIYVPKKLPLNRLPIEGRIPKRIVLPTEKGEIEFITDIQEATFHALSYTSSERPAPSGIDTSVLNLNGSGTLGGLVRDRVTNDLVMLSNNHVLADQNDAALGDPVLQPGEGSGGTHPANSIGRLSRFVPIDFSNSGTNRVDAAIATPNNTGDVVWHTRDIGPETPLNWRYLNLTDIGRAVRKTGRTTEHTQGFIESLYGTYKVKFGLSKFATFVDQVGISHFRPEEPFSDNGDSGSIIYDHENYALALLFAGSDPTATQAGLTIANPINYVLTEMNIEMLTSGDHPSNYP